MTQTYQVKKRKPSVIKKSLHPLVEKWFFSKFEDFSLPQQYGVMNIFERKNILISAPTGATKTLTAFLAIINRLVFLADPETKGELEKKVYAVYSSPLKALSSDIHKNLEEPLSEIENLAKEEGKKLEKIRVALRTGDTSTNERAKMSRNPPHILVTTPETLAIVLTSKKFIEAFRNVEYCIVDEIHSLENKRGVYLSLSMERLNKASQIWPVKIGLSATVEPLEDIAKFLVGIDKNRKVGYIKVPFEKNLDIDVITPGNLVQDKTLHKGMYHKLHELIQEHKTTLIFTNTRAATERVVDHLKDAHPEDYGEQNIAAHHSSLGKSQRYRIEERLRKGELKVVVCSTSLELGIDIGYIDLVALLGSPKSSSRALQRVGRAGHRLHQTAKGRFIVLDRDDLIECSVIQKEMKEGKIDRVNIPQNCLDVLSQQIYGMAIADIWDLNDLLRTVRKSYCYANLTKEDFLSVISYLSGEYNLEKNRVYRKIWYDPEENKVGKSGKLARVIYMTNIGTIPEESFVTVKHARGGEKIGVIDEAFMSRMKKGDVFTLGGRKYQYKYTKGMNLYVISDIQRPPTIPSWFSEMLPLSFDTAMEINKFRKLAYEMFSNKESEENISDFIKKYLYVNDNVAKEIYDYFYHQHKIIGIPGSQEILMEKYFDPNSKKNYLLVNSMYGRRVNDALSRAIGYLIGRAGKRDVEIGISDSGFYFAYENLTKDIIERALEHLQEENLEKILKEAVEKTDILTRRFRHCASRSLMILRSYKGQNKSVKKQQMKSHFLIAAVKKISSDFPILKEAKREVLEDLMDVHSAKKVIHWIKNPSKNPEVKVRIENVSVPSPFSLNLLLQGRMDLMRMEDKQEFLKRMHQVYKEEINKRERGFTESFLE